jgi:tetratricopeptide (TPR) repeat protein
MKTSAISTGNKVISDQHYTHRSQHGSVVGSYSFALKHYTTSLEMKSRNLPPQHPSIAATLETVGRIYESTKDYSHALSYFQKASGIYRRLSPTPYDKIAQIDEHIQRISRRLKQ